jgi:hypothetical protein
MKTSLVKFQLLLILILGLSITSCNDNADTTDDATAEAYAEEVIFRTQEGTNMGRFGCYELVFPITINFPDGSNAEVTSYEVLKSTVKDWRKNNPRVRTRPSIAFPYDIISADGEVITVTDEAQQRELKIACGKDFFGNHGPKGHDGRGKLCFKVNFPFSVALPDSTVITLNSKEDRKLLHDAIKAFKEANPNVRVHPELVFPISVTMEDGTIVTVNSKEELRSLKDSCK